MSLCVCFSAKSKNWSTDAQNCTKVCSHGPLELADAEDHCKHHKNIWSYNISNPISKPKWFGRKYWLLGASYGWIASGYSDVSQTLHICSSSYLKLLQGLKESLKKNPQKIISDCQVSLDQTTIGKPGVLTAVAGLELARECYISLGIGAKWCVHIFEHSLFHIPGSVQRQCMGEQQQEAK